MLIQLKRANKLATIPTTMKILGAILLIMGTSIGGGILALPVATAALGFFPAVMCLFVIWLIMTLGALLMLEVNAWFPVGSHLISMAGKTVGKGGQIFAWISYLLLLYSLMASYVAGGQDILVSIFAHAGIVLNHRLAAVLFTVLLSSIVFYGIRQVDRVNRVVMFLKLLTFFGMIFFMAPFLQPHYLCAGRLHAGIFAEITVSVLMVMVTAFGFAIIIPSLRVYFENDFIALRRVVLWGSAIPLIFYVLWESIIFLTLPPTGPYSLHSLAQSAQPVTALMDALSHVSHYPWMVLIANIFTAVCVISAILGVSLCLIDFLADGLVIPKTGLHGIRLLLMTFFPPLGVALFAPRLFMYGFSMAGIFCVFLLILLPAWMAWNGRYRRSFNASQHTALCTTVPGGKALLLLILACGTLLLLALSVGL